MAEYPTKKTQTLNAVKNSFIIGSSLPIVHSLNGNLLKSKGFICMGREYVRGKTVVVYNGVHWLQNNEQIQFYEDIKERE